MAISLHLDPVLDAMVAKQAAMLGVTKSDFIRDALERVLCMKCPATLLKQVRQAGGMKRPAASARVSASVKAKLRETRLD